MIAEFIDPAILGFILVGVMLFAIFIGFPISFTLIFLGFVFGYLGGGALPYELSQKGSALIFAFSILPFIIVMSSITATLWYWGILPFIVNVFSKICQKLFNIGGPIGLGAAANVIVGQVEAPLLIRPYLTKLSNKELLI